MSKRAEEITREHVMFAPYGSNSEKLKGFKHARQELYFILHEEYHNNTSLCVHVAILMIIAIATLFYILQTLPWLSKTTNQKYFWEVSELVVTIIFAIEYFIRLLVIRNMVRYILKPMHIIDLLAVVPYLLEKFFPLLPTASLRVLRVIRLARLGRMRHLFSEYIEVMWSALQCAADEAGPMMIVLIFVQVILFGSIVYAFENGMHADGDFESIPDTMWYVFTTITSVGYGDLAPVTFVGRCFGVLCMMSGIALMSICVIIIGGNFEQIHQTMMGDEAEMVEPKMNEENNTVNLTPKKTVKPDVKTSKVSLTSSNEISPDCCDKNSSTQKPWGGKKKNFARRFKTAVNKVKTANKFKRHHLQFTFKTLEAGAKNLEVRVRKIESYTNLPPPNQTNMKNRSKMYGRASKLFLWLKRSNLLDELSKKFLNVIMTYLNDDERFLLRELNSCFYREYYNQNIRELKQNFKSQRAINLGMRDRSFPLVEVLCILPHEISACALRSITTQSFPKLRIFHARSSISSDGSRKWHPSSWFQNFQHGSLEELDVCLCDKPNKENSLVELTRFPILKKFNITYQKSKGYHLCSSHNSLRTITIFNGYLETSSTIDHQNFPALREINSDLGMCSVDMKAQLASMGIVST